MLTPEPHLPILMPSNEKSYSDSHVAWRAILIVWPLTTLKLILSHLNFTTISHLHLLLLPFRLLCNSSSLPLISVWISHLRSMATAVSTFGAVNRVPVLFFHPYRCFLLFLRNYTINSRQLIIWWISLTGYLYFRFDLLNPPLLLQLSFNGSSGSAVVPNSSFLGSNLKKIVNSRLINNNKSFSFKIFAAEKEIEETQQTDKDRWKGLAYDMSDDQQDITRGKGMVDSLFQAPQDAGTHFAVMSSYEYVSTGLRSYVPFYTSI